MHRSSDTIATIAAALAKAQVELTNPEKSLVATIRSPFPREADRTFRYAPLSSGLDIVRKSLGRHEIATIQATDIDTEAGLLRLTTVLAHSSGEWISSEWPVCQITDIASAQRVGAALTYARRYALFTMVGIAGEDDLDAPDLGGVPKATTEPPRTTGQVALAETAAPRDARKPAVRPASSVLAPEQSAALRERLILELQSLNSGNEAATWAHRNLPVKTILAAADAKIVEERFRARLSTISNGRGSEAAAEDLAHGSTPDGLTPDKPPYAVAHQGVVSVVQPDAGGPKRAAVDGKRSRGGSVPGFGKTIRLRDKEHRKFVTRQACLVCGRVPSDAHHLTFTQPRALGRRVSDEFTVPLCRLHHRELHRSGNETAWWQRLNIDPLPVALRLWQHTQADRERTLMTHTQAVNATKMSAHDQARTSQAARTDPESTVSKSSDGLAADDLISTYRALRTS
jgi:hypothetical protein